MAAFTYIKDSIHLEKLNIAPTTVSEFDKLNTALTTAKDELQNISNTSVAITTNLTQ